LGVGNATRADVSRLFGRVAFGATAEDLDRWTGQPYDDVVDFLLDVPDPALRGPAVDDGQRLFLENITRGASNGGQNFVESAQLWWLERMRTTPYPVEERMVLFWHDHFATAWSPAMPDIGMLLQQNQTLRKHALATFPAMVREITLDPAMLFWLNGNQNFKGKPNENYARELFELFTLGTLPQVYTERDIREAARALTGWTLDPVLRIPQFVADAHDTGTKTIFGRTIGDMGADEYREVVDIAIDQPVSRWFIAYKMVLNFAHVPTTTNVLTTPGALITAVAEALRSGWNIKSAMRALMLHDEFRSPNVAAGNQNVRQPIELAVGACKALGVSTDHPDLIALLQRLRQLPLAPPNVGGWPTGRNWLSPLTAIARYGVGLFAAQAAISASANLPAASDIAGWASRFGLAGFSDNTRTALTSYLSSRPGAPEEELRPGISALIVSSPEWMVM
jgi:uncharacterized protein (DUF1800 family)